MSSERRVRRSDRPVEAARLYLDAAAARHHYRALTHADGQGLVVVDTPSPIDSEALAAVAPLADELPAGIELSAALLDRGQERYNIYCQPCHGETGHGNGPATRRGGGFAVAPANFHQQKFLPVTLGYFFDVASNGKGSMKGYKAQIPVEDRWAIAAWVRTLQVTGEASVDELPEQAQNQRPRRIQ